MGGLDTAKPLVIGSEPRPAEKLLRLADDRYGPLKEAEVALIEASSSAALPTAGFRGSNGKSHLRPVRAEFLRWLLTDDETCACVDHRGWRLENVHVVGELDLANATVKSPVSIRNAVLTSVDLTRAKLNCLVIEATTCQGSFEAHRLDVDHGLRLTDFTCTSGVALVHAHLGGDLSCSGMFGDDAEHARTEDGGVPLDCDDIEVGGNVFLTQTFRATGVVRFVGAQIDRDLTCEGKFTSGTGEDAALMCDRSHVKGSVYLWNGFEANGRVRFLGATIGGDFNALGTFGDTKPIPRSKRDTATPVLDCESIKVAGNVFVRHCEIRGHVRFNAAAIDGGLRISHVAFKYRRHVGCGLRAVGATVRGTFEWCSISASSEEKASVGAGPELCLILSGACVNRFIDDRASWPAPGRLQAAGFTFSILEEVPPTVARRQQWVRQRIEWCRLQDSSEFSPHPYSQLATFLQRIGHDSDARTVRIASHDDMRRHLNRKARFASRFLGWTIGHGYRPGRALLWGLAFVLIGYLVFHLAHDADLLKKSPRTNGSFSALGYSVDTLIPVVTFGQDQYWSPVTATVSGQLVQLYMWVHILVGWVLTSLGVLAVTGLVRKD